MTISNRKSRLWNRFFICKIYILTKAMNKKSYYSLELLNITVPSNNGTRGSLSHILRTPQDLDDIEGSLDYDSWSFPADEDYESIIDASECTCDLSPVSVQCGHNTFGKKCTLNPTWCERKFRIQNIIPLILIANNCWEKILSVFFFWIR